MAPTVELEGEHAQVQNTGCLLALTPSALEMLAVSATAAHVLGNEPAHLLTLTLSEVFGSETTHQIRNVLGRSGSSTHRQPAGTFNTARGTFDIHAHLARDFSIVELTPSLNEHILSTDRYDKLRWITTKRVRGTVDDVVAQWVENLRAVTGFDRVAIMRTWPDGSFTTVAESVGSLRPILGRRVFEGRSGLDLQRTLSRTPLFVTYDAFAETVPLIANDPSIEIDLGASLLRAQGPELASLRELMGVRTAIVLPILIDERMWGEVVFHHQEPGSFGLGLDRLLSITSPNIELSIEAALARQSTVIQERAIPLATNLLMGRSSVRPAALRPTLEQICDLIPAAGIMMITPEHSVDYGRCPASASLDRIREGLVPVAEGISISHSFDERLETSELSGAGGAMLIDCPGASSIELLLFRQPSPYYHDAQSSLVDGSSPRVEWDQTDIDAAVVLRTLLQNALVDNLEIVVQELNHRIRNILSLVQSIVDQSLPDSDGAPVFEALKDRIFSLATAHNLLAEADARMPLAEVFAREAEPYGAGRVSLTGPAHVAIEAEMAPTAALAIHEAFSNAAKYGALSTTEGRLDIRWTLEADGAHIVWAESGGPPVVQPRTSGFGMRLISNAFEYQFGGAASVRFESSGTTMNLFLPNSALDLRQEPHHGTESSAILDLRRNTDSLLNGNVLVLEDDFLIAMRTEDQANQLGADRVFLASSNAKALKILRTETIDFAVIDINLGDEQSTPSVKRLAELEIPFIFLTGYDTGPTQVAEGISAPLARKPVRLADLRDLVREAKQARV